MALSSACYSSEESTSLHPSNESIQLANDIAKVSDRLDQISIDELSFLKNLEEWRNEAHQIIDEFCKLKSDEYQRRIKEDISQIRQTINLFSSDHDAAEDYIHWVKETIQSIDQQLNELKEIQSKFIPLQTDHSLICFPSSMSHFERHPTPLKDLFSSSMNELTSSLSPSPASLRLFSLESLKQTMKLPSDHCYSLATNETHLLISGKSNLFLIDRSLNIVKKKAIIQVGVTDICWSKILSRFILIFPREIFLLNEKNFSLESCSISLIDNNPWERGTTSERNLFLSTFGENPLIIEYNLFPSIHLNKRYQSSIICGESEMINDIKSNETFLGLIIDNGFTNQSRLELRSIKSFQCISSIDLGRGWGYRCSSLPNDANWIVTDSYNQRFIFITNNGTIHTKIDYPTKPFNVVHWGEDQFLIRTRQGIDVHQC